MSCTRKILEYSHNHYITFISHTLSLIQIPCEVESGLPVMRTGFYKGVNENAPFVDVYALPVFHEVVSFSVVFQFTYQGHGCMIV